MKAIYEIIKEALTSEGRLPDGFELLNGELAPNEIHWVAGAMDGVGIFHMGKQDVEKAAARIAKLLVKNDTAKIPAIVKKHGVLHLIDQVLSEVRANAESVDAQSLIRYAMGLAFDGSDVELVKLGIAIIGLFDWSDNPEVQERLVTLGLYDEFTLYVLVAAQQWDNENEIIFRLAKSVDGWGKIHAVERLKPETAEIRDWILRHGCENAVMDAYLGLECANKGGLIEALRQDEIDDELFGTICVLMDALFDEGPVPGISEYEHAAEAVRLYLRHALNHAAALKHLWHILNVPADSEEGFRIPEEAKKTRSEILARESWHPVILETLGKPDDTDFFYAVNAGSRLGMDISEQLFSAVTGDPLKHSMWIRSVYEKPEHAKALTELLERTLPLEKMATGMNDYFFATEFRQEHSALESALTGLRKYPNLGEPLVLAGLNSPVTRERNQACGALEEWSRTLGQPIASAAPALYETLVGVAAIEVNKDSKEAMMKLINAG